MHVLGSRRVPEDRGPRLSFSGACQLGDSEAF